MTATCATCRFWKANTDRHYGRGDCRRHAPFMVGYLGFGESRPTWAFTASTDWCGEHEEKPWTVGDPLPSPEASDAAKDV